jgi:hypothetical protein
MTLEFAKRRRPHKQSTKNKISKALLGLDRDGKPTKVGTGGRAALLAGGATLTTLALKQRKVATVGNGTQPLGGKADQVPGLESQKKVSTVISSEGALPAASIVEGSNDILLKQALGSKPGTAKSNAQQFIETDLRRKASTKIGEPTILSPETNRSATPSKPVDPTKSLTVPRPTRAVLISSNTPTMQRQRMTRPTANIVPVSEGGRLATSAKTPKTIRETFEGMSTRAVRNGVVARQAFDEGYRSPNASESKSYKRGAAAAKAFKKLRSRFNQKG